MYLQKRYGLCHDTLSWAGKVLGVFFSIAGFFLLSDAVIADEYEVLVQDIHSRGLLNDSYDNVLCSTTSITMNLPTLSTQPQIFIYHTPTAGEAGVFVFKRDKWVFSGGTVTFNPWYRYNDGVSDCIGSYSPAVTGRYDCYKTFAFPDDIPVDPAATRLIVLIHGWNPDNYANPYESYGWPSLVANLTAWAEKHPGWKVLAYNWGEDAATGPVLELSLNMIGNAIKNGTQAAEISHQHGQNLGPVIKNKLPNLKKIQFIAHSAGTWNARASAIYLAQNMSGIDIQVTLLDPYIPGEAPDTASDCTKDKVNDLAAFAPIVLLDNYFYVNDVFGTETVFTWRATDINKKLGSTLIPNPFNHMTPVTWYGASIKDNPADGWLNSIAFNDLTTDGPTGVAAPLPAPLMVMPPFPNPFNPATTISYTIGEDTHVRVAVYDILGREETVLVDDMMSAGSHSTVWNGTEKTGNPLGSGTYLYRITAGVHSASGKIVLLR